MNNMLTGATGLTNMMTNAKNATYGTTENDFQDWLGYGSARREREYQTYMSNTAYQRAVADMKEAGLNPGLMYGSGDAASTPAGGARSAGKGVGVISSIAGLLIGGAKMMEASHVANLDKSIAKTTLNIAKNMNQKTPPEELEKVLKAQREKFGIKI